MALASLADYTARYGAPDTADTNTVSQLIEDASALVCQVADQTISWVDNDVATIETGGDSIAFLPELPVTAVSAVSVDGVALAAASYDWWSYGMLKRLDGIWPNRPRSVSVTYDHGYDVIPAWIVGLVCTMAERARTSAGAPGSVQSETFVDAYSVTYETGDNSGQLVGLKVDEVGQVRVLNMAKAIA